MNTLSENPFELMIGFPPVIEELKATGKFEMMDLHVDEAEHSMEMHLPYLAKVFHGYVVLHLEVPCFCYDLRGSLFNGCKCRYSVKIVPILVGALSAENEAMYGRLLAKYVDDPNNFFSVSSDFCHWGSRYVTLKYFVNPLCIYSFSI